MKRLSTKCLMLTLLVSMMGIGKAAAKEAYAVYSGTKLSFYYDDSRTTRYGTVYDLNTGSNSPGWYADGNHENIITVVFDSSFKDYRPTSTAKWFAKMHNLDRIEDFQYLKTEKVTNMQQMFQECEKLILYFQDDFRYGYTNRTNPSAFKTDNVTNMGSMFAGCIGLRSLDLSGWNTSKVTTMESMFWKCTSLVDLRLGSAGRYGTYGWNTSKVTNMISMFSTCSNLSYIYVGNGWKTDNVQNSTSMFSGCNNLVGSMNTRYDANYTDKTRAHIDGGTSNPGYLRTTIESYVNWTEGTGLLSFYNDERKPYHDGKNYSIDTNHSWTENAASVTKAVFDKSFKDARPTTTGNWFAEMKSLTTIEGLENLNTSEVIRMSGMFMGCKSLTTLNLNSFNTGKVEYATDMFNGCTSLQRIFVSEQWTMEKALGSARSARMFSNCTSLVGGAGTAFDANHVDASYAHIDGGTDNPGYLTGSAYTEYNATTNTLTFYGDGERHLKSGTIYELTSTGSQYPGWFSIKEDITKVVFDASFATARPVSLYRWFNMPNLETITNIRYLNTSEVRDMRGAFWNAQKLTGLDLSRFNTEKVTEMTSMFKACMLEELDLSSFNTQNVTNMRQMFASCSNLKTIVASGVFTTDKVTDSADMFYGCNKLIGSAGTRYDSSHTDKTYAHVDGGTSNPGYFSDLGYVVLTGTSLYFYYDNQRSIRAGQGTVFSLNKNASVVPEWTQDGLSREVTRVYFDQSFANARPAFTAGWFNDMPKLTTINGMEYLNTTETVNMNSMFVGCKSLTSVDLTHLDTKKVTNMGWMFSGCTALKTIYVGDGWNTDNVTESSYQMFYNCTSLVGGLGTAFDASYVDKTYARVDTEYEPGYLTFKPYVVLSSDGMLTFYCDGKSGQREGSEYGLNSGTSLPDWTKNDRNKKVIAVEFDPSFANARPTSTAYWFYAMTNMTDIQGLEYLNTSEVVYMTDMFYLACAYDNGVTTLDLSYFDTSKVKSMENMFSQCLKLKTIIVGSKWSTASVTNSTKMFQACNALKGGAGTTYNANYVDATRAHVDGGTSNPGYLTAVSTDSYKLSVGGKAITGANYKRITPGNGFTVIKSGTVTFDPETMTLTLTDAVIDYTGSNTAIYSTNTAGLNIVLVGDNKITSSVRHGILGWADMTISGSGSLTIEAASCGVYIYNETEATTLTIRDCSLTSTGKFGITGFNGSKETLVVDHATIHATGSTISIGNFQKLELKGCVITQPKGAYLQKNLLNADGNTINTEVIIEPGFLKGDVNGDGTVGIGDIVAITNVMAGIENDPEIVERANVNDDESVGIGDIVAITNIMAGIE